MSASWNIFVASTSEIDEFANELAIIFEAEVVPSVSEDCFYAFVKFDGELHVQICTNFYDTSHVSEKQYPFELWVMTQGPKSRHLESQKNNTLYVFDKLKATRKYSLLAFINFEEVLARFDLDANES